MKEGENMSIPRIAQIMEQEIAGIIAQCSFARPQDTNAYAIGDVVGATTASGLMSWSVGTNSVLFIGAVLANNDANIPSGQSGFKLHLYNLSPTPVGDNAAFNLAAVDVSKYIGYIQFDTPIDVGDVNISQIIGANIVCKSSSGIVYGMLVTDTAYTPGSGSVTTITIRGMQV